MPLRESKLPARKKITWRDALVFVAITSATLAILCFNGMRWFDFFDMCHYLDAGWRLVSGQRLYQDFFFHAGPIHAYLHALFIWVFGFNKFAILAHLCFGVTVMMGVMFAIARDDLSRTETACLVVIGAFAFYGPISHPWHDENASLWLLLALVLFHRVIAGAEAKRSRATVWASLLCGALVGLSFLTKTNIGAAGMLMYGALFLVLRPWRELAYYIAGVAAGVFIPVLCFSTPSLYLYYSFLNYHAHDRLLNFSKLGKTLATHLSTYLLLVGLTLAVLGKQKFFARYKKYFAEFFGLIFVSLFAAWSGSALIVANICLVGVEMIFLYILAAKLKQERDLIPTSHRRLAGTLVLATLATVTLYTAVTTQILLTWTWRRHPVRSDYAFKTDAMKGWRCDPSVCPGVDKAVAYIREHVPKSDSLFVFPDAMLIYALTGHESYRQSPVFFQRPAEGYETPLNGEAYIAFEKHFLSAPPQWIVLHHQVEQPLFETNSVLQWLHLDGWIAKNSIKVWEGSDFEIRKVNGALTQSQERG